jgi:hypothetical protein
VWIGLTASRDRAALRYAQAAGARPGRTSTGLAARQAFGPLTRR